MEKENEDIILSQWQTCVEMANSIYNVPPPGYRRAHAVGGAASAPLNKAIWYANNSAVF